jgi:hypothetical protein
VGPARDRLLPRLREPLESVFPDRLQHLEPRLAVRAFRTAQQALVHDGGHAFEHVHPEVLPGVADGLRRFDRAGGGEDGQATEEALLRRREHLVAPVDRRSQRLLPRGHVFRSAREDLQAVIETGGQRRR